MKPMTLIVLMSLAILIQESEQSVEENVAICTADYIPVCGEDGVTYGNQCMMEAKGVNLDYEGECLCPCQKIFEPQCGKDGITYPNKCEMDCKICACTCTYDYNPVCGIDGETYVNECSLNCADVEKDHDGEC